jgi:hypothetical protein
VVKGLTPTLRQFAEKHFLPFIEGNSTASTTKDYYRLGWQDLANQPIADQQLDAIRKPHVEVIQIAGSNATHNRALRTLRRIFNVAFELDVLPKVPDSLCSKRRAALNSSQWTSRREWPLRWPRASVKALYGLHSASSWTVVFVPRKLPVFPFLT